MAKKKKSDMPPTDMPPKGMPAKPMMEEEPVAKGKPKKKGKKGLPPWLIKKKK